MSATVEGEQQRHQRGGDIAAAAEIIDRLRRLNEAISFSEPQHSGEDSVETSTAIWKATNDGSTANSSRLSRCNSSSSSSTKGGCCCMNNSGTGLDSTECCCSGSSQQSSTLLNRSLSLKTKTLIESLDEIDENRGADGKVVLERVLGGRDFALTGLHKVLERSGITTGPSTGTSTLSSELSSEGVVIATPDNSDGRATRPDRNQVCQKHNIANKDVSSRLLRSENHPSSNEDDDSTRQHSGLAEKGGDVSPQAASQRSGVLLQKRRSTSATNEEGRDVCDGSNDNTSSNNATLPPGCERRRLSAILTLAQSLSSELRKA